MTALAQVSLEEPPVANSTTSESTSLRDFLRNSALIVSWMYVLTTLFMGVCVIAPVVFHGWKSYIVQGESMAPLIDKGDIIINKPNTFTVDAGSLITFSNGNSPVTHRVVEVGEGYYVTKGDNNTQVDSSHVPFDAVLGDVSIIIPKLGLVSVWANEGKWNFVGIWAVITLGIAAFLCTSDTNAKKKPVQVRELTSEKSAEKVSVSELISANEEVFDVVVETKEVAKPTQAKTISTTKTHRINSAAILSMIPKQYSAKVYGLAENILESRDRAAEQQKVEEQNLEHSI